MKNTTDKIYQFISKLVILLDTELDELKYKKNTIDTQKNITVILTKLVNLIFQLNKMTKEPLSSTEEGVNKTDQELLDQFIKKIKLEITTTEEDE